MGVFWGVGRRWGITESQGVEPQAPSAAGKFTLTPKLFLGGLSRSSRISVEAWTTDSRPRSPAPLPPSNPLFSRWPRHSQHHLP